MLLFQENMTSSFSLHIGPDKPTFHFRTRILESAVPFKIIELGAQLPLPAQVRRPFFTWHAPLLSASALPVLSSLLLWGVLFPCCTYQVYSSAKLKSTCTYPPLAGLVTPRGQIFSAGIWSVYLWSPLLSRVNTVVALQTTRFPDAYSSSLASLFFRRSP